jgi:type I site-specific restriction endonuclease
MGCFMVEPFSQGGVLLSTEADTCRQYVLPKLYDAGWTDDQISQERHFTN